jgi:phage nucleotide-binding protein
VGDSIKLEKSSRSPTGKSKKAEAIASVAADIIPVSDIDSYLKMCVYSRNGVGKTRFACSSHKKTLVLDCNEKGWVSVRKRGNVSIYPVSRWEQADWVYWFLKSGRHDFEVVVIDTITMLSNICMKWILHDEAERDSTADPALPTQPQWGKLAQLMKDKIIDFRNLPMDVIFTAQEKRVTNEDEDGGVTVEIRPEVSPATLPTLTAAVSVIGRLYTREVKLKKGKTVQERRMLLGAHPVYISKNRYEELKPIERDPTLDSFYKRIEGDLRNAEED